MIHNAYPIVIWVENSDNFFCPTDSEIEFEGVVVKSGDDSKDKKSESLIFLINHGIMFLFDKII